MIEHLVTGGAGFIGSHLVEALLGRGDVVHVLDDFSYGHRSNLPLEHPNLRILDDDVSNVERHAPALGGVTRIFHLAALISGYESLDQAEDYFRVNRGGTLALIRLCARLEQPRIVFASSSTVYGNRSDPKRAETDVPAPATVYALTKLIGEHLLSMYRDRLHYDDTSLRLFNVYGPRQNPTHPYANVTCKFSQAAALGLPVKLYGDGQQTRDFVYVSDVVDVMLRAADGGMKRRVYNVGTGIETSITSLLELVQKIADRKLRVEALPAWSNDIRAIRADVSALASDHGFEARVALAEGLAKTIGYFRSAQPLA